MIEQPVMVKICDVVVESPGVKTFFFRQNLPFVPGQFIMVWIPYLDEKPFTIAYIREDVLGISVLKRGPFTTALHEKKIGDWLGIRGPYGKGFRLQENLLACVMGGGIGMASVATVADRLKHAVVLQGARTSRELLYRGRFPDMKLCTDDGSAGLKGTAVDLLKECLEKQRFQKVYACGPERMLHRVVELCGNLGIECEVSLERYVKCGFGVCGQCDCSGQRVCLDGPVFNAKELSMMDDFGKRTITKTGERIAGPAH